MLLQLLYFRITFGLLLLVLVGRYFYYDWIRKYFIDVGFTFPHFLWDFFRPLPPSGMYVLFLSLGILAIFILFGIGFRISCIAFSILFAYQHLLDKANFLNHYYLVFLLCVLSSMIPLDRKSLQKNSIPVQTWHLWMLRFQLGIVYFFGAIAKCKTDWMLYAQPLKIWLLMNRDLPFLGEFLAMKITPYLFSYAGFLFDFFIFPLLLLRQTYKIAYVFVLVFHILTYFLFPIGMFPFLMVFLTPICFPSNEFQKIAMGVIQYLKLDVLKKYFLEKEVILQERKFLENILPDKPVLKYLLLFYYVVQILLPFRYLLYQGNMLWTEEGFRYSWHIMAAHKSGFLEFFAINKTTGFKEKLNCKHLLTERQWAQMSTEPVMIYQFAHFLGKIEKGKGRENFGITVDSAVSLNGHPFHALIKEDTDLLEVPYYLFKSNSWITRDYKD